MRYIKGDIIEIVCGSANKIGNRFIFEEIYEYDKNSINDKYFDVVIDKSYTKLVYRPFKNWIKYILGRS